MKKTVYVVRRADTGEFLMDIVVGGALLWINDVFGAMHFNPEAPANLTNAEKIFGDLRIELIEMELTAKAVKILEANYELT
jgi:hypothetical protein